VVGNYLLLLVGTLSFQTVCQGVGGRGYGLPCGRKNFIKMGLIRLIRGELVKGLNLKRGSEGDYRSGS